MDALLTWFTAIAVSLGFAPDEHDAATFFGYTEAQFVDVSPTRPGKLVQVNVRVGDWVKTGQPLFEQDHQHASIATAQAKAQVALREAELVNLQSGQRDEQIAVIEQQLAAASAAQKMARNAYSRAKRLARKKVVSISQLDKERTEFTRANASLGAIQAQLSVARLPARPASLVAAQERVNLARIALRRAELDAKDLRTQSPTAGRVENVHYEFGEFASAGKPVLTLLPDGATFFRFYVPEPLRASLAIGQTIDIFCTACEHPIPARLTRLSRQAIFTPPMIYSREERAKLVFLAEASPTGRTTLLPGQPIHATAKQQ